MSSRSLAWLSDIHLNFLNREQLESFIVRLAKSKADFFLISGDIGEAETLPAYLNILDRALERPVYFVLGNHDYYGSGFEAVRKNVADLCVASPNLIYLTSSPAVELTQTTTLIGHDGWADGSYGNYTGSDVLLNDYVLISEFLQGANITELLGKTEKLRRLGIMQSLAIESVRSIKEKFDALTGPIEHIILCTHVPPFQESCLYAGKPSNDFFLPHFSCKILGSALLDFCRLRTDCAVTVLCGHTHNRAVYRPLKNLTVHTAGAVYGEPEIQRIIRLR